MESNRQHEPDQRVEHTSPIWRVLAIALVAGSAVALGFAADAAQRADDFATIVVITIIFTLGYWADKRPDRMRKRLGPFSKIAAAVQESRGDLRQWVFRKPLAVGAGLAILYGLGVVVGKNVVVALMQGIYSWYLAVAVGAAIAAVAAEPRLFQAIRDKLAGPPDDDPDDPDEYADEPEQTIRPSDDPPDEPPPAEGEEEWVDNPER